MKTTVKNETKHSQSDINFVKKLAKEYGYIITEEQAIKALNITNNDYYQLKEYFNN
jgi:hypothetical protein